MIIKSTLLTALFSLPLLADVSPFGVLVEGDMQGMWGDLYNLKEKIDGSKGEVFSGDGKVNEAPFGKLLRSLAEDQFSKERLSEYVTGEVNLAFTNLIVPRINAKEAPEAFGVGYMDPSAILIIYEGKIETAPMGKFRLAGYFDDVLQVYLNDDLILDASHNPYYSDFKPSEVHPKSLLGKPYRYGSYVEFKKGDNLKIILAEVPGGQCGGALFIQKEGQKYKKDDWDFPILPPFCLEKLSTKDKKRIRGYKFPVETQGTKIPEFRVKK